MSLYSFKQFTYGTNTVIALLGDYESAKVNFEFSDVGSLTLDYPKQGVSYAGMVSSPLIEVGAFLDNVEIADARFVVPTYTGDEVDDDKLASFSGKSLLWLFSKAIVYSSGGSTTVATNQVFNTSTPGGIVRTLAAQNAARGGICAGFTFTSFSSTTDSNGNAWANLIGNITYEVGTDYLAILRNLVDNGLVEIKLVGRDFRMYNGNGMGVDRTVQTNPIVLFEGRDIKEAPFTATSEGVAGVNLIKGDDNILAQAVNAGTNAAYGRWENYISQGGVKDTTTLSVIAQAELQRTSGQRVEKTHALVITPTVVTDVFPSKTAAILRGVNSSGGEFGTLPGTYDTDYHYDTLASLQFDRAQGHRTVRLAFKWERIQPTLGAALNATEKGRIDAFIANAATVGLGVILNLHNFGEYNGVKLGAGGGPTQANLVDLWTRISTAYKSNTTVVALGLMNEPNGLPPGPQTNPNRVSTTQANWLADDGNPTITPNFSFGGFTTIRGVRNGNNYNGIQSPYFAVTPGEKLTATADVYPATRAGRSRIRFEYKDSGGNVVPAATQFSDNPTIPVTTWTTRSMTVTVPAGVATVKMSVYLDDQTTAGDTWYIKAMYVGYVPPLWHSISQACVTAIRGNADTTCIMVAGDSWSGVADWVANNGTTGWITDSANNFMYEGHHYYDGDHSGIYTNTYATEVTASTSAGWTSGSYLDSLTNRIMTELVNWRQWLTTNGARGYVGEYGWPRNIAAHTGDYTSWNTLGSTWLTLASSYGLSFSYWSTSEWWGTYLLSLYDTVSGVLATPNSQAAIVEAFPQPSTLAGSSGTPQPLIDYYVSDWVFSNTAGASTKYRIRQLVMEIDSAGAQSANVVLNDKFQESDVVTARKVNGILGGATVTGSTGTPSSEITDATTPSAPASLTLTSATMVDAGGAIRAQVTSSWPAVTTNTDSSTISDLDRYEVQYQTDVTTTITKAGVWSQSYVVPAGTTTTYVGPISPGTVIRARVKAVDSNAHSSAWTQSADITTATDTTPPPAPSTPTVVNQFRGIQVTWNGLDNLGGAMPGDYERCECHVSTVNNFTPSSGTLVDSVKTRGGVFPIQGLTYGTTYYAKLIAYDTTGNASSPSAQGSSTPAQLSDPDLPANLVTGAKIAIQTIAVKNLTVGTFTENLLPNGNMEDTSANSRPSFWENVGTVVGSGSLAIMSTDATSQINGPNSMKVVPTATVACEFLSSNLPATEGDIYYLSVMVKTSRVLVGGGLVKLMVYTGATSGAFTTTFTVATVAGSTSIFQLEGQVVVPAGHRWMTVGLYATTDTGGAYNAFFDDAEMRKVVGTANIANASINNAKIANLAVDDAKIASLAAGKITTGTLSADVILGARIRTASSGNRVDISGIGIEMYRGTFRTGWWRPDTGQLRIYNDTDASATSTGHGLQFGDDNGWNLIIDNNEIMARDNGGASDLYLTSAGGSVGIGTAFGTNPYTGFAARFYNNHNVFANPTSIWADSQADPSNDTPPLLVGDYGGLHLQIDDRMIQAVNGSVVANIKINSWGGQVQLSDQCLFDQFGSNEAPWMHSRSSVGGNRDNSLLLWASTLYSRDFTGLNARDMSCRTLFQTSGRATKTDIVDISGMDVLSSLADVKVYSYTLLDDPVAPIAGNTQKGITPGRTQIGPMAEDLQLINPSLVEDLPHVGPSINVASMLGILFQAGKNLRQRIVSLNQRTSTLETDVAAIKTKVGL